jgi:hypothetical protein
MLDSSAIERRSRQEDFANGQEASTDAAGRRSAEPRARAATVGIEIGFVQRQCFADPKPRAPQYDDHAAEPDVLPTMPGSASPRRSPQASAGRAGIGARDGLLETS